MHIKTYKAYFTNVEIMFSFRMNISVSDSVIVKETCAKA